MATSLDETTLAAAAREFLTEAMAMAADFGEPVRSAVRAAATAPLSEASARHLYSTVLTRLADARGQAGSEVAQRIAAEVEEILIGDGNPMPMSAEPTATAGREIELVEMHGLKPRPVLPVPHFLDKAVPLEEGYVDVNRLPLWVMNDRVQLEVQEFEQRNDRLPNQEELLLIMTGDGLLPSVSKKDPFSIRPLAQSIARRGVERAPIITAEGEPKDGNRRLAACKYILNNPSKFSLEAQERARYVRVWKAPPGTTEDQFEAIVVALNFEGDYKQDWAEFIKARKVYADYERRLEAKKGSLSDSSQREIRRAVGEKFSISLTEVGRYVKMVTWANDFETYHVEESGRDEHETRYRTNDIFQWFYEIDAGQGGEKLTRQIEGGDDDLRGVVYDLMWDTIDSGRLVRGLHKVIAEDDGYDALKEARELLDNGATDDARDRVKELVGEAELARKKRLGLQAHVRAVRAAIEKLGATAPDQWQQFTAKELEDLEFAFDSALATIRAELRRKGRETSE